MLPFFYVIYRMAYVVYILFSQKLDRYYTGATSDLYGVQFDCAEL